MLSKSFKSNKLYEVTRYWFKYGNEDDVLENTVTVWDTFEKAISYIERYATGLKFESANIEEVIVDREITADDYRHGDYEYVSTQKIYNITLEGVEDFTREEIVFFNKEKEGEQKMGKVLFNRYEIKNGADLETFFDYKEALKRAEELNTDLFMALYSDDTIIERRIVNKAGNPSDIQYICVQKVINGIQYEHVYELNNVHKRWYNEVSDKGYSLDKKRKINLCKVANRINQNHGVNCYIIYKDDSQNGVCLSEYDLNKINEMF